jgi:23S rRNA (pseudouridine1915-N3)-methyltransferase|tara:strand:- start:14 stop:484 length:471 start_codon:yes stop_codon:yes gene_type:complete
MKIVIAAVGKLRSGPEKALFDKYIERLPWKTSLIEVVDKGPASGEQKRALEEQKLLGAIPEGAGVVVLDEAGKALPSLEFAKKLGAWQDQGTRSLAFILGGADGLSRKLQNLADLRLSLGAMTWPHLLARVLLAEQLYRASTVLSGHPYHRAKSQE